MNGHGIYYIEEFEIVGPYTLRIGFDDHSEQMKHDAYSRFFFDVFRNDQTLFVSADEVEAAWKWIDQLFAAWHERGQKCEPYEAGTEGPTRANRMVNSRGQKWYDGEYCPIDLG